MCLSTSIHKWYDYINEKGFFRDLEVIEGSVEALKKLQEQHEVYIVSAAMEFRNSLEDKLDWLARTFSIYFLGKHHLLRQ